MSSIKKVKTSKRKATSKLSRFCDAIGELTPAQQQATESIVHLFVQKIVTPGAVKKFAANTTHKVKGTKPIKRPPNAFTLFAREMRPAMKERYPDSTFGEMGKALGEAWRDLSVAQRMKYENMTEKKTAKKKKTNYNKLDSMITMVPKKKTAKKKTAKKKTAKKKTGKKAKKSEVEKSEVEMLTS